MKHDWRDLDWPMIAQAGFCILLAVLLFAFLAWQNDRARACWRKGGALVGGVCVQRLDPRK